jgi:2,4-dienoyl-CoA reductase-like NADH-dependent reductase (Old Yellow Enzyme family)
MHLLSHVERYLRKSGVAATRLGREAVRDPRFVHDLRNGREPRTSTTIRVLAWIDAHQEERR